RRALARGGYTRLERLAQVPEPEIETLHSTVPTGITALRDALDERGLAFRNERRRRFQMAKLIYSAIASLDGYVEDEQGKFDWAAPDDEVHAFVNEFERRIGTYLYGRRMYETMVSWETVSGGADQPAVIRDFAEIWRAAEKIVYSRTLRTVSSARTRIERDFDPDAVRRLKETSAADITVGGAELAGQAT